jgi:hypothetical protein
MAEDRAHDPRRVVSLANFKDGEEDFTGFGPVLRGIVKQQPKESPDGKKDA